MITKEIKEKIYDVIKKNSFSDGVVVVLGGIIELKSFDDERGSGIDVYKYVPQEEMEKDDDYDFDSDYITTVYL